LEAGAVRGAWYKEGEVYSWSMLGLRSIYIYIYIFLFVRWLINQKKTTKITGVKINKGRKEAHEYIVVMDRGRSTLVHGERCTHIQ
jgi:hypothetical protein